MKLNSIVMSNDSFAGLPCFATTSIDGANTPLTNDNFAYAEATNDNVYHTSQSYSGFHDLTKPKNLHQLSSLLNNSKLDDAIIVIASG
jgi:hypothetical protein